MATVSDLADSYELPNFIGPYYSLWPNETPAITMAGVTSAGGGQATSSYNITWQDRTNAAPAQLAILEGATPLYRAEPRSERENVTQIFQRGTQISYTKQSATGKVGPFSSRVWSTQGVQPVQNEFGEQIEIALEFLKRSMNWHFWNSTYALGTDNTTARQTRGFFATSTTNKVDNFGAEQTCTFDFTGGAAEDLWTNSTAGEVWQTGDEIQFTTVGTGATGASVDTPYWVIYVSDTTFHIASSLENANLGTVVEGTADSSGTWKAQKASPLTRSTINNLVRVSLDAAEPAKWRMPVIFVGGVHNLTRFSDEFGVSPESRTVGGVTVQQVHLDGIANPVSIVYDTDMPIQRLAMLDMSVITPHWLITTGRNGEVKGALFYEDRPSEAADYRGHVYGDMGWSWGPEAWHGWVDGLTTQG